MEKLKIAFFVSGRGSNMKAVIDNIINGRLLADAVCIISNNSNANALKHAVQREIATYHISHTTNPNDHDEKIIEMLDKHQANIICLAGYLKKVSNKIIQHMKGRVINIHPSLLPKYGGEGMYGINVHKAVIQAKESKSGATVHVVNSEYDSGRILLQGEVPVKEDDTPESLADRVLKLEHDIYTDALMMIVSGDIEL